jgi:hypothetical protein
MPEPLNRKQRRLRSQVAANVRWADTIDPDERRAVTEPGRRANFDRYLKQADPDGVLPEDLRVLRAKHLRKADMARLALASSKARRKPSGTAA